nr:hypothetical protein [Rhodoferax sp. PAMC 29310]
MASDLNPIVPGGDGRLLPSGRFAGRVEFEALVQNALHRAATDGWSEIILSDADFSDWPLNQTVVIESLNAWAVAGRRLTLLATGYDEVHRHHPRFVAWRRTWGHLIEARVCDEPARGDVPSAIWSPAWFMHRTDPVHQSGLCGTDPALKARVREALSERLRASTTGFSASILGL